ncbi:metallophosphoesterase family protein [Alicyclobacillus acidoterrestris]|uniref:metallophosphoesterase family protein n=1 Tax=Alicyclobacillus acidoterrestris TaxID=1450 RepID=UPI003F53680E
MTLRIAVLGDVHYPYLPGGSEEQIAARDRFYADVFEQFFAETADLYVCVGDVTHTGHPEEWAGIARIFAQYHDKPFRFVLGNHDTLLQSKSSVLSRMNQQRHWGEQLEHLPLFFLDTTQESRRDDWGGTVDREQLEWIRTRHAESAEPLFVFAHHPLYNTTAKSDEPMMYVQNYDDVEAAMASLSKQVFYFNRHNHVQSIAKHPRRSNWVCIQTASILSGLRYRVVEVTSTSMTVNTKVIDAEGMKETLTTLYQGIPDYWHNPDAVGEETDGAITVQRYALKY